MKKLVFILSAMLLLIGTMDVQAQWGKKLLKKAGESAKRATERNVERKVEGAFGLRPPVCLHGNRKNFPV